MIATDNNEVFGDLIKKVFDHFEVPLKNVRLDGTTSQWHFRPMASRHQLYRYIFKLGFR